MWGSDVPRLTSVVGNYPNPFNSQTIIKYNVGNIGPIPVDISVVIYDVLGREVATVVNKKLSAGRYNIQWDASGMASGVYYYRLKTGDFVQTKKMVLLK